MATGKKKTDIIRFSGTIDRDHEKGSWSWVEFPHDVHKLYGTRGSVRVKGTINGIPIDRALMPTKSGYHMIIVNTEMRRKFKAKVGDTVIVELWRNPDPQEVIVPDELQETLEFMEDLNAAWNKLRPSVQRGICYWISSGKTVATRAKRVAEVLRRFETGHEWFKQAR
ncbi:MAG: YdeI/OmpD-associated family protein [Flavobacteriales bacterium]